MSSHASSSACAGEALGSLDVVIAPRILFIQHEDDCPPEWFGEWFDQAGLHYDVARCHRGDAVPEDLSGYDGLVVLGGDMGAYDDAAFPWLTSTKGLIATVIGAGQCFLGICLGHQLATVALGGTVIVNPAGQAKGLTKVALTDAGRADPFIHAIRSEAHAIQWNGDIAAELPVGAVPLATAPDGTVQAVRFADRAWGVQFHPETSPEVFATWGSDDASAETRQATATALRQIKAAECQLRSDWEPVARRFADVVRASCPAL